MRVSVGVSVGVGVTPGLGEPFPHASVTHAKTVVMPRLPERVCRISKGIPFGDAESSGAYGTGFFAFFTYVSIHATQRAH